MTMYTYSKLNTIKPFLPVTVAVIITGLLVALDHSVFSIESHVVAGLWMALITAMLITAIQIVHTEKAFSMQFAQLAAQKERLANEIKYRLWAEKTSSENKAKLQIVDDNFPGMLAYCNTEQRCHYHNRAFRQWFGLRSEQIENHLLREFLNGPSYTHIAQGIERVLSGETVQNQYVQQLPSRSACLVTANLIPHYDSGGKVIGFYILYTPRFVKEGELPLKRSGEKSTDENDSSKKVKHVQGVGENAGQRSQSALDSARRIILAIEREEFRLFCQKILPVKSDERAEIYYEILIRMAEEESNLVPPGAFLPLIEKHNLMSRLDGWVVKKIIQHLSERKISTKASFCINLSGSTLKDPTFIHHIQNLLEQAKIQPEKLCFEIETFDVMENLHNTALFIKKIQQLGCLISLCSFDHNRASFDLLKHIKADFLKIDGSMICNILRNAEDLKKTENINKFAHALKIRTIGELVETQAILEKLAGIGIDYAQGFAVKRPLPIEHIH